MCFVSFFAQLHSWSGISCLQFIFAVIRVF